MQKKEALLLLRMIHEATEWLVGLTDSAVAGLHSPEPSSTRVFSAEECEYLPLPCRRFILALEQQGILDAALRERIIHHALELKAKNIDIQVIEGITRIILSRHPEGKELLARMELLVAEPNIHTIQ